NSFVFAALVVSLLTAGFVHYVFGGIKVGGRTRGPSFSRGAQVHVAVLVGLGLLTRAFGYWLDRYEYAIGNTGLFDGIGYTDANARIPSRNILIAVAIVAAILFFTTIVLRSWTLPILGLGALVVSSVLIGGVWPAVMQQFQVDPSQADREEPFLARNIEATRKAYGVEKTDTVPYSATTELTPQELSE